MIMDGTRLQISLEAFREDGFCVIEDVLEPVQLERLRSTLDAVAADERRRGLGVRKEEGPHNQRVYALTHKASAFVELLEHPLLWSFMSEVLGPDFLLSSLTANISGPEGPAMYLHPDQVYIPPPWPPFPLVSNMMWMLDDFTVANGATKVVPGSHRWFAGREVDQRLADVAVPVTGKAGSVLCFDGRLLHQTGANVTDDQFRRGLLTYCCKPWIRQQENSSLSVPRATMLAMSEPLRQLIGLKMWAGLGSVDGPLQAGLPADVRTPA